MKRIVFNFALCVLIALAVHQSALAEETLDLRGQSFENLSTITARIDAAANAVTVDLTGVPLTVDERKSLMANYPNKEFLWTITVFGRELNTNMTEVDLTGCEVNDIDALCGALDCLPGLRQVLMYKNYIPRAQKDLLFDRYPNIFFGWTLKIQNAHYTIRTDTTAFSSLKDGSPPYFYDKDLWWVRYLRKLEALDLGHNMITDLSFLYDLPNLKILILACNYITDISPVASLSKLEYLELFKNDISDLKPLSGLANLIDLNLCGNQITDVSPLFGLKKLERVWLSRNKELPQEQRDAIRQALPDAELVYYSIGSTGSILDESGTNEQPGWRDHPRYKVLHALFKHSVYMPWNTDV